MVLSLVEPQDLLLMIASATSSAAKGLNVPLLTIDDPAKGKVFLGTTSELVKRYQDHYGKSLAHQLTSIIGGRLLQETKFPELGVTIFEFEGINPNHLELVAYNLLLCVA